jgi:site-specific recombinase XerD
VNLAQCIHKYFEQYLPQIRGASPATIDSYQQALTLFLKFSADYLNVPVKEIEAKDLSFQLIIDFLDHLQTRRSNSARTRNIRLACLKSLAKMIRLMYPEHRKTAEMILGIPQKRCQKHLIGFLNQEEMQTVFKSVDLKKHDGFRDYTLLHLLFDSGARASEVASLKLDDFNPQQKTLAILGKQLMGDVGTFCTLILNTKQSLFFIYMYLKQILYIFHYILFDATFCYCPKNIDMSNTKMSGHISRGMACLFHSQP